MRVELFNDELPDSVEFGISQDCGIDKVAIAKCNLVIDKGFIYTKDFAIMLNDDFALTLHTWLEIIVHEMIHLVDYLNYPKHYLDTEYDEHGDWFISMSKQFKQFGFDIKTKLEFDGCHSVFNVSTDKVMNKMKNEMYLGYMANGVIELFKILKQDKNDWIDALRMDNDDKIIETISVFETDNPKSIEIPTLKFRGENSMMTFHRVTKNFNSNFGPFKKVDEINLVEESTDDSNEDEILKILNSKKSLTARKVGKNVYELRMT